MSLRPIRQIREGIFAMPPIVLFPTGRCLITPWLIAALFWISGCATPPAPQDAQTIVRQRILNAAEQMIGTPYQAGGESPDGVDCSGLVQYAYRQAGIRVPRTTADQFRAGRSQRHVLPGDLLFFRTDAGGDVSHVGIYAGQGRMIHASSGSGQVRKVSLNQSYWQQRMVGGTTFLGVENVPVTRSVSMDDGRSG